MNIFVLDQIPDIAASYLCDSHVIKMTLESCQLLSAADISIYNKPQEDRYAPTWRNHPACKCLKNWSNYIWLVHHLSGLLEEYEKRYSRVHKCKGIYEKYWKDIAIDYYPAFSDLSFPQLVNPEFKEEGNDIDTVVRVYRKYYKFKRDTLSRFKYRLGNMPDWLKE